VKTADFDPQRLARLKARLDLELDRGLRGTLTRDYPELGEKGVAGSPARSLRFCCGKERTVGVHGNRAGLLSVGVVVDPAVFSHAVATGGWLKWVDKDIGPERFPKAFAARTALMLLDVQQSVYRAYGHCQVEVADARCLPFEDARYTAVITSPPYPNRHDYTRVFGVELMFGFLDWKKLRELRYQSFHSHPEARPERLPADGYVESPVLTEAIGRLHGLREDRRVLRMLGG
jgi:hypothetical protein